MRNHLASVLTAVAALLLPALVQGVGIVEIYREAALGDPELRAVAANRDAVGEGVPQARATLLPDAALDASSTRSNFQDLPDSTSSEYEVSVVQPLFRRDRLNSLRGAQFDADRATADYYFAEQDLIIRVTDAYFGLLRAIDNLEFARGDLEATGYQLDQAKRRFDVGLVTITDVHEAQARYDLANADLSTAEFNLDDAKEALRELTGSHHETVDRIRDELPLEDVTPYDIDAWVAQAMEQNPAIASARFAVDSAREAIERERAGHLPTLDAVASYFDSETSGGGVSNLDRAGFSIGLRFNVNLYAGGGINSRIREARFRYQEALERLEDTNRAIERQTRDAFLAVKAAISRVKALEQAVVSTRSSLEATQAGFEVGTRTIVDVLNAQRDALRAQRDFYESRYVYVEGNLVLRQAAGTLSVEELEQIQPWLTSEQQKIDIGSAYRREEP